MRNLTLLLMMAACSKNTPANPCAMAGATEICIAATINGNVQIDRVNFLLVGTGKMSTTTEPGMLPLPFKIGLVLPSGSTSPVRILAIGIHGTDEVAGDTETVSFSGTRGAVTFTLDSGTAPDLQAPPDLLAPDLLKQNPTLTPSPAAPMGYELDPVTFTVAGADPAGASVITTLGSVPPGATATSGATATFNWTPNFNGSGMYTINASVSTPDNRMAMLPINLTILNAVDSAPPLNQSDVISAIVPTHPIGDFDGDGKGDLASCSVLNGGSSPMYIVDILYGSDAGLPKQMPPPSTAVQRYNFPGTSTTTTADNTRLPCGGADMDGDGLVDIVIQDQFANTNPGNGQLIGQIYVLYGTARANPTSPAIPLVPNNLADGEVFSNRVFVGHYQAGGKADVITLTFPTSGGTVDRLNIFKGVTTRPTGALWPPPETHDLTGAQEVCGHRQVIGLGDTSGDGLDEVLLWDKNVGSGAACTPSVGGFTLVQSGVADRSLQRDPTSPNNFGVAPTSTFCDVDGDGNADLVVSTDPNGGDPKAQIYFAPFGPSPSPALIAANAAIVMNPTAGRVYNEAHCVPKFFNGASLLLMDTGDANNPARVDIISGTGQMPMVLRAIPDPDPTDKKYGNSFGGFTDIDGDGKHDAVIGAQSGRYWAVYGR